MTLWEVLPAPKHSLLPTALPYPTSLNPHIIIKESRISTKLKETKVGTLAIGEGATPFSLTYAAGTCSQGRGTPSLLLRGSGEGL